MIVVGVDGCKGGWVAAEWDTKKGTLGLSVHKTFAEFMATSSFLKFKAVGVDIPIGLTNGPRRCDIEARKVLYCRRSSVFPAPCADLVDSTDYRRVNAESKERYKKGISKQAFGIFPKVAEINLLLSPELRQRVVEVHPEISFWAMNGSREVCPAKHFEPGRAARLNLLRANLDIGEEGWEKVEAGISGAKLDDVLDAIAAAWSARRWVNGSSNHFPREAQPRTGDLSAVIIY